MAGLFFGCGSDDDSEETATDKVASCDISTTVGEMTQRFCFDYSGLTAAQADELVAACTDGSGVGGNAGTGALTACSADNAVGTCAVAAAEGNPAYSVILYPDFTADDGKTTCDAFQGTWTAN